MRTNATLAAGQIWRVSDPRRLRAIKVVAVVEETVYVDVLYPRPHGVTLQTVRRDVFQQTGTKGMVRIK